MLHAAVWSGGTFIYVPKGVKVELPLQAYFRMNEQGGGQFEHTLIIVDEGASLHYIEGCSSPRYSKQSLHAGCVEIFVKKGAHVKYSSIENWSKNVFNLNTKRALVEEDGKIDWVNGNMGSTKTMLYPCSVLLGDRSSSDSLGVAFAGAGQDQDTGAKVIHVGKNTSSVIRAKSISKNGGISSYRGLVKVMGSARGTKSRVECDALILDEKSVSKTYPYMRVDNKQSKIEHEASVSKVSEEQLFYLTSRGLSEDQAIKMIVSGFIAPVVKALPLEYAIELNKLIELEIEGM
jgi:Fe-S cluster assembly protein SufB